MLVLIDGKRYHQFAAIQTNVTVGKGTVVTDLNVGYAFSKNISASFTINNLFNVLPKWKLEGQNAEGSKVLEDATAKQLLEGFLAFSGRYKILG